MAHGPDNWTRYHVTVEANWYDSSAAAVSNIFSVKTFTELNLYTESGKCFNQIGLLTWAGLAKIAIGVRLEGVNLSAESRSYRYTSFNRGEPELPTFNQEIIL